MTFPFRAARGFTLVEMIVTIVITGIVAAIVAVFIRKPVEGYVDMARRADLTDVADTAVRRIARDVRLALPNSLYNPGDSDQCVEFIPTRIGGRYRAEQTASGTGNILDFTGSDPSFDMLWLNSELPAANRIQQNDLIVVYNDGYVGDAYTGNNRATVTAVTPEDATEKSTRITFSSPKLFPAGSPSYRFQVIPHDAQAVAYVCSGGTLYRKVRTLGARLTTCPAVAIDTPKLAENATCSLKYEPPGSGTGLSRNGILSVSLTITQSGESVKLYQQVHVDNVP